MILNSTSSTTHTHTHTHKNTGYGSIYTCNPSTRKAEVGISRIGSPLGIYIVKSYLKTNKQGWKQAQWVEILPNMHEAMCSILSTTNKKEKKTKARRYKQTHHQKAYNGE
jgi:hypothetical protein